MNRTWVRALVSFGIIAVWIASIFLPAVDYRTPNGIETALGSVILQIGWMGGLAGQFGWLANLLLVPGLILAASWPNQSPKALIIIAIGLIILVVNSAFWSSIPLDNGDNPIVSYRAGYWLWMLAMLSAAAWLLGCAFTSGVSLDQAGDHLE